jgi:hypothetical protein
MTPEKKKRVTRALGFVSGVIASMDAIRDQKVLWPPSELWEALRNVQRVELAAGVVLILVSLLMTARRKSTS